MVRGQDQQVLVCLTEGFGNVLQATVDAMEGVQAGGNDVRICTLAATCQMLKGPISEGER